MSGLEIVKYRSLRIRCLYIEGSGKGFPSVVVNFKLGSMGREQTSCLDNQCFSEEIMCICIGRDISLLDFKISKPEKCF